MNKTININLANTFFHIDETAYEVLKSYLKKLEKAFQKTQGKEEILRDIEVRIAELFQERKQSKEQVISIEDVESVIETLGQPEDFITDTEEDFKESFKENRNPNRKLYRDPDDKYIGGVTSGLGYFFGIDTSWIRILWLVFSLFSAGTLILIYLVLWIVIPEAKTTAEKLKMKGEPINISTIEKKIKEEFEEVSSKIKDIDYQKATSSLKKKSTTFFSFLERILSLIPKLIFKIIGVVFVLVSSLSLFGIVIGTLLFLVFGTIEWPFDFYFNNYITSPYTAFGFWVALLLLVLIPFLLLFSLGIRLLKRNSIVFSRVSRIILLSFWFLALVTVLFFGLREVRSHSVTATKTDRFELSYSKNDTLTILKKEPLASKEVELWNFERKGIFKNRDKSQWIKKNLQLSVLKSSKYHSYLEVNYTADGSSYENAQSNAKAIQYNWEEVEKKLLLNSKWTIKEDTPFQNQKVHLKLYLVEGQIFRLDSSLKKILSSSLMNNYNLTKDQMMGKLWLMGNDALLCLNCDEEEGHSLNINYKSKGSENELHLNVDSEGITLKKK
ncbi:MAG: PspC domain-containing protein [Flavobacteriaceae bacterium]